MVLPLAWAFFSYLRNYALHYWQRSMTNTWRLWIHNDMTVSINCVCLTSTNNSWNGKGVGCLHTPTIYNERKIISYKAIFQWAIWSICPTLLCPTTPLQIWWNVDWSFHFMLFFFCFCSVIWFHSLFDVHYFWNLIGSEGRTTESG